MAWNEPGGGKDDDPWGSGGRRGEQGPPDLDEAFRNLQNRLTGLFGGGGSGSGGGAAFGGGALGLLLLVVVLGWAGLGFYTVDEQERGVVFRFGAVQEAVVLPGLRWNPPLIDEVQIVNVSRVESERLQDTMLTEDENIVDIAITVQYVRAEPLPYATQVRQPERSLAHAAESALRHVVGSSALDYVITEGRELIAVEVQDRLQTYLDSYGTGIRVDKVNIDEAGPPRQVEAAFDEVQRAKEDRDREINEANAFANKVVPEARGEAEQQIQAATAYRDQVIARAEGDASRFTQLLTEYTLARDVTRERLYIDAMESVLGSSTKVLVDVDGGNNMLYLPLDRMMQGGGYGGGTTASALPGIGTSSGGNMPGVERDQAVREIADEVVRRIRDMNTSSRREGRGR